MYRSHEHRIKSEKRRNEIFGDTDPVIKAFLNIGGMGAFLAPGEIVDFVGYAAKNTYLGVIHTVSAPPKELPTIDQICNQAESLDMIPILILHREYCKKVHFYDRTGAKIRSLV